MSFVIKVALLIFVWCVNMLHALYECQMCLGNTGNDVQFCNIKKSCEGALTFDALLEKIQEGVPSYTIVQRECKELDDAVVLKFSAKKEQSCCIEAQINNDGQLKRLKYLREGWVCELTAPDIVQASGLKHVLSVEHRQDGKVHQAFLNVLPEGNVQLQTLDILGGSLEERVLDSMMATCVVPFSQLGFDLGMQEVLWFCALPNVAAHACTYLQVVCDVAKKACSLSFLRGLYCTTYVFSSQGEMQYAGEQPILWFLPLFSVRHREKKKHVAQISNQEAVVAPYHSFSSLVSSGQAVLARILGENCALHVGILKRDNFLVQLHSLESKRCINVFSMSVLQDELQKSVWRVIRGDGQDTYEINLGKMVLSIGESTIHCQEKAAMSIQVRGFGHKGRYTCELPLSSENIRCLDGVSPGVRRMLFPTARGWLGLPIEDAAGATFALNILKKGCFFCIYLRRDLDGEVSREFCLVNCTLTKQERLEHLIYVINGETLSVCLEGKLSEMLAYAHTDIRCVGKNCVFLRIRWMPFFAFDGEIRAGKHEPLTFDHRKFWTVQSRGVFVFIQEKFYPQELEGEKRHLSRMEVSFDLKKAILLRDKEEKSILCDVVCGNVRTILQCALIHVDGKPVLEWGDAQLNYRIDCASAVAVRLMLLTDDALAIGLEVKNQSGFYRFLKIKPGVNLSALHFFQENGEKLEPYMGEESTDHIPIKRCAFKINHHNFPRCEPEQQVKSLAPVQPVWQPKRESLAPAVMCQANPRGEVDYAFSRKAGAMATPNSTQTCAMPVWRPTLPPVPAMYGQCLMPAVCQYSLVSPVLYPSQPMGLGSVRPLGQYPNFYNTGGLPPGQWCPQR